MRLATIRRTNSQSVPNEESGGTNAALIEGDEVRVLSYSDAGAALAAAPLAALGQAITGEVLPLGDVSFAPVIPRPGKIICVGLNYADHIAEMGNTQPTAPTCFAKFANALIGANDDIHLPPVDVSAKVDWEVELAIVIGARIRNASTAEALAAVAGYTIMNDISMRDWQKRTSQFLLGKTWEHATPLGPWIVDTDTLGDGSGLTVRCLVNGKLKQESSTDELVFGTVDLVAEISRVTTLEPGDVIATGTPGGVGFGRTPPEFLDDGDEVVTEIEGIGAMTNRCRRIT